MWTERENDEDPDRISKLSKPAHEKFCACRECTTALLNSCPPGNARPRMVEMFGYQRLPSKGGLLRHPVTGEVL
ncbi:MAG: hypothetical protein J4432_04430 [DPANN group archaeon]|nr:hypothetical protein [DPANN group archaeon]